MTTSGFAEVDDQLERRPVASCKPCPLTLGGFRRNPLGGVQIPLLPPLFNQFMNILMCD